MQPDDHTHSCQCVISFVLRSGMFYCDRDQELIIIVSEVGTIPQHSGPRGNQYCGFVLSSDSRVTIVTKRSVLATISSPLSGSSPPSGQSDTVSIFRFVFSSVNIMQCKHYNTIQYNTINFYCPKSLTNLSSVVMERQSSSE